MSTRLHLGALWVVSYRNTDQHWVYTVFTSKKEATKYGNYVLDSRFADSVVWPRRFIPRDAKKVRK